MRRQERGEVEVRARERSRCLGWKGKVSLQPQTWSPEQSLRVWQLCCAKVAAAKAMMRMAVKRIVEIVGG